jgi:hypothetical protein
MEVARDPANGNYVLHTWVRQCAGGSSDCSDVLGTFFEDTRVTYDPAGGESNLEQSFNLASPLNTDFNQFLFGFTSASEAGDSQVITIKNFQLSFIRSNDPLIAADPQFP